MLSERRIALQNSECILCFNDYGSVERGVRVAPVVLGCGHDICHGCSLKRLQFRNECPSCRAPIVYPPSRKLHVEVIEPDEPDPGALTNLSTLNDIVKKLDTIYDLSGKDINISGIKELVEYDISSFPEMAGFPMVKDIISGLTSSVIKLAEKLSSQTAKRHQVVKEDENMIPPIPGSFGLLTPPLSSVAVKRAFEENLDSPPGTPVRRNLFGSINATRNEVSNTTPNTREAHPFISMLRNAASGFPSIQTPFSIFSLKSPISSTTILSSFFPGDEGATAMEGQNSVTRAMAEVTPDSSPMRLVSNHRAQITNRNAQPIARSDASNNQRAPKQKDRLAQLQKRASSPANGESADQRKVDHPDVVTQDIRSAEAIHRLTSLPPGPSYSELECPVVLNPRRCQAVTRNGTQCKSGRPGNATGICGKHPNYVPRPLLVREYLLSEFGSSGLDPNQCQAITKNKTQCLSKRPKNATGICGKHPNYVPPGSG